MVQSLSLPDYLPALFFVNEFGAAICAIQCSFVGVKDM